MSCVFQRRRHTGQHTYSVSSNDSRNIIVTTAEPTSFAVFIFDWDCECRVPDDVVKISPWGCASESVGVGIIIMAHFAGFLNEHFNYKSKMQHFKDSF